MPCDKHRPPLSRCGQGMQENKHTNKQYISVPVITKACPSNMSRPVSVASEKLQMLPPSLPNKLTTSFVDNGDLFATNLRLLNFDQLEDWPAISNKTFSTKDAQQNQKQRIRCTEWALFRLFEIWDLEEARNVPSYLPRP